MHKYHEKEDLTKKINLFLLLFILSVSINSVFAIPRFKVVSYNLLQYDGLERNDYLKTVLTSINPDLIVVQEIESQVAVDSFKISVLDNRLWTIPFHNGNDTDNHIFYNPYMMEIISTTYINTDLRDIAEYKLRFPLTNDTLYIYSAHLKAGNPDFDPYNQDLQRLDEITVLRDEHLNTFPQGTKFIVCGDLNLYKSTEPAYQKLLGEEPGNYGQIFDPINQPGEWHNNAAFADIQTQSSRLNDLGDGGSTGGMDDRFDFILISGSLRGKVVDGSYKAYGNDGNHFNQAINNGTNSAVSVEIANALHAGSDHLPIMAEIDFSLPSKISDSTHQIPEGFKLEQNYPNPFNPRTYINYRLQIASNVELSIYNLRGQRVAVLVSEKQQAGYHHTQWDAHGFASGIYYYIMKAGDFQEIKKMVLLQ